MSNLALVHKDEFQEHLTPESHPESPQRLAAINQALLKDGLLQELSVIEPVPASLENLSTVHAAKYIEELENKGESAIARNGIIQIDPDTWMSPKSYSTAKLAAGAGLEAVRGVMDGAHSRAFVIVRPPGHHALPDAAMGFCLFNNIAVAARHAQLKFGVKRVMIIDWDVHHGNGTQDIFYDDPSVLFVSFQQFPFWPPDSGWYTEIGTGEGRGYNINIPLPAGTGDKGYLSAWDAIVTPLCREYKPELILLSAGYDAHENDPLGEQKISTVGYFMLTDRLADLADELECPIVGFLEGGYDTRSLADSVLSTVKVLNAGGKSLRSKIEFSAGKFGGELTAVTGNRSQSQLDDRLLDIKKFLSKYWTCFRP